MNLNLYNTTDYERKRDWTLGENKPNSNPNKPNLRKAKMNVNLYVIEDYRKKDDFAVRINKPNFRKAQNERKRLCHKRFMKMKPPSGPKKTNPIQTQPVVSLSNLFQMPTNPLKEREEKRASGTFSGSQLPERIYYMGNPGLA
ncbi:unnamed protein product [marine sediment metagenome]|uniref:Uncharacterized protein n=1 Tax=marine sediment metagenome TaxID=412755 RepID=X0WXE9_9ZZZZ